MFWPIALAVVWFMAMVMITVWWSQYVAEANQRIRRAYDREDAVAAVSVGGLPEMDESRFVERDGSDPVTDALEQRLRGKDSQLRQQADQLNQQAENLQKLIRDLDRERESGRQLSVEKQRLEDEVQALNAKLRQRAIRGELAKIGWLPLHGSCLPNDDEPILVGCLDDGGTLLDSDGVWHANFAGTNDGNARLSDGAGGGVDVALDGSALWIPVHTWRIMVDRERSIELLNQLDRSVATRLDDLHGDLSRRIGGLSNAVDATGERLSSTEHDVHRAASSARHANGEADALAVQVRKLKSQVSKLESELRRVQRSI